MNERLVSIIMPSFNSVDYIEEAINSVKKQIYKNWELIIVDDCSVDSTKELLTKFSKNESRIKVIFLAKNQGAANARNIAIKKAAGTYIAFLDSDDIWYENKLSKQIEYMNANNYNFTCTNYSKINKHGEDLNKIIKTKKIYDYEALLKNCPGNSTVIYNSLMLGKFYIPNIRKRNDYLMWLELIKNAKTLNGLSEVLSAHRIRENSISSRKVDLIKYHWKIYREYEKISYLKSIYLLGYWILKGILKK